ncbi:Cox-like excisionase and repressor [Rhodobacteraceae phage LS06-2018-MD05]|nr:Cox-like excisionase and repressor [Rhodobacteraceae phage LS06-2018-MD05]
MEYKTLNKNSQITGLKYEKVKEIKKPGRKPQVKDETKES